MTNLIQSRVAPAAAGTQLTENGPFLIETRLRLEIAVTHCKQREAMGSNRDKIAPPLTDFFGLGAREN
jgi:hypothetical protein